MTIEVLPVILAGGGGTRLWPLSREHYPKQFLALGGETTLLQQTFDRVSQGRLVATPEGAEIHFAAPLVVCNDEHRFLVAEQARLAGAAPQAIVLEPALVATALRPRRPFQGWRYLTAADAPPDIGAAPGEEPDLPPGLRKALSRFGVLP